MAMESQGDDLHGKLMAGSSTLENKKLRDHSWTLVLSPFKLAGLFARPPHVLWTKLYNVWNDLERAF